ncbi:MAG: DUF2493 domain-containing protein [Clostridia bacterium]|nr:DUF2493 domain-containing protein [Clostridia bacterium]
MKVAVVGSRSITVEDIGAYLPDGVTTVVSGGARGVDACAAAYAREHGLELIEIRPQYRRYRAGAPLMRNEEIVRQADAVVALWDGVSKGTAHVIGLCQKTGVPVTVYIVKS